MSRIVPPPLVKNQRRLLEALFEEGGLSTTLIRRYVVPHFSRSQAVNELSHLRDRGLVASAPLSADGREEHCWVLTYGGARALGRVVVYQEARYQAPSSTQLEHKALTLRLGVSLRTLNWAYLRPYPYNTAHPKPADTPQRLALVRAVAAHFARTPPGAGTPRLHPSQVPEGLNDWVAWPAGAPEQAVVIIVHPVGGTVHFWRGVKQRGGRRGRTRARTLVYGELARIVPVVGLFASRELARDYTPILQAAQIHPQTGDDLLAFLLRQGAPA